MTDSNAPPNTSALFRRKSSFDGAVERVQKAENSLRTFLRATSSRMVLLLQSQSSLHSDDEVDDCEDDCSIASELENLEESEAQLRRELAELDLADQSSCEEIIARVQSPESFPPESDCTTIVVFEDEHDHRSKAANIGEGNSSEEPVNSLFLHGDSGIVNHRTEQESGARSRCSTLDTLPSLMLLSEESSSSEGSSSRTRTDLVEEDSLKPMMRPLLWPYLYCQAKLFHRKRPDSFGSAPLGTLAHASMSFEDPIQC